MSFKTSCCSCLGLFSLLGALFYATMAIMVWNRNQVFLEHKVGFNVHTTTEEEYKTKFWQIAVVAIVSIFSLLMSYQTCDLLTFFELLQGMLVSMVLCCSSSVFLAKRDEKELAIMQEIKTREARVVFEEQNDKATTSIQ